MTNRSDDTTDDHATPDTIELDVTADDVARHLARCESCRRQLEAARDVGTRAMEVWRREFARCFGRTRA